ncbi:MAG: hypothetical protein HKN88_01180 [Gammaproteobacteria bacterium]|nr:hypothetical protein [Gammaproteobacteria bacterium]NNC96661.1 hypothetical protein [Gammaproteobacteria bacterium]NNM12994.1 hypothetical protein [Gammaproteobacteria bacterium]
MKYGINAYAVDVDELISMIGSHDVNFLNSLKFDIADDISRFKRNRQRPGDHDIEELLSFIVFNDLRPSKNNNADYAYALELMCKGMGKAMYPEALRNLSRERFVELHEINELGSRPGPLFNKIPWPDQVPRIGCIPNREMRDRYEVAMQLFTIQEDHNKKAYYHEYIGWLIEANKRGSGLVTFMY